MRWEEERYVRVYTRDTAALLGLGWEARALFWEILRKADRAGIVPLGKSGTRGLAGLTGIPFDVVERSLPLLLEEGCVEQSGTNLVVPNYIEAQEASMSPAARQKESRERRRDMIRSGLDPDQRATVVYFIQSENGGHVKIGRADDLAKRMQGLATGRPDKLVLLGAFPGTLADERRVHEALAQHRDRGEWFHPHAQVMAAAAAAKAGATADEVLAALRSVTGDGSGHVTGHKTSTVTPNRTVPGRTEPDHTHSAREDEPLDPNAAAVLAALRSHPALAEIATLAVAEHVAAELLQKPKPMPLVVSAIDDLARNAGAAAAAGEFWPAPLMSQKLSGYINRAKPPSDTAQRGPSAARYAPPEPVRTGTKILTFDDAPRPNVPPTRRIAETRPEPTPAVATYAPAPGNLDSLLDAIGRGPA